MALSITTNITGTPNELDRRAARLIVARENARRAALDPPGTALLVGNDAQLAASYITVLNALLASSHASYVEQASREAYDNAKAIWDAATDAQRAAALAALQA